MKLRGVGNVYQPTFRDRKTGEIRYSPIWWIYYSHLGKLHRESSQSANRADAVRLLKRRTLEATRHGKVIAPAAEKLTLANLRDMLIADYDANGQKTRVIVSPLAHLVRYFGEDCRAIDLTSDRITTYIAARQQAGAANSTINRSLASLKRAFRLAVKAGKFVNPPVIDMLREDNARKGFFERAQFEALLEQLPDHLRAVVKTAYLTGWRITSEILTRQKHHVDLDDGWLRLEPGESKNREGRNFPLIPELRAVLEDQLERTRQLETAIGRIIPWLFHRDGEPIRYFRRSWLTACKHAGLSGRIPHDFRRTAVRNLERAGVPRSAAMAMVGHKTMAIYSRYAIVDENMLRESGAKLANLHQTQIDRKIVPLNRELSKHFQSKG